MEARTVGDLAELTIGASVGLYFTALGRRWIGKAPGVSPEYDLWHQKYGSGMKLVGPLLVAVAVMIFFISRARTMR